MFTVKIKEKPIAKFHLNDPKPELGSIYFDEVLYLSADGDELELIRSQFENLPITKGDSCTWSGGLAQFVFRNMDLA